MLEHLKKLTPLPRGLPLNKALTRDRLEAIQACILALAEGANLKTGLGLRTHRSPGLVRVDLDGRLRRFAPQPGPFTPLVEIVDPAVEDPEYIVTVTDGVVVDRETNACGPTVKAEAVIYHRCANRLDDDDEPYRFPIKEGESVFVHVKVKKSGAVGADEEPFCELVVDTEPKSEHYVPPVDPDSGNTYSYGSDGEYYYKLGTLKVEDGYPCMELWLGGDNIQHFRELPKISGVGTGQKIFKQYNPETGEYQYFTIKGISPVVVTRNQDTLEISLYGGTAGGNNLDLTVKTYLMIPGTGVFVTDEPAGAVLLRWRDGHFVDRVSPASSAEALPGDGERVIEHQDVARIESWYE